MAIFAGDIPGALLRIPGTPASAAYADEAYAMTKKGQGEVALGAGVVFSAIGGIFGTIVLVTAAPTLAEVALRVQLVRVFLAGLPRPDLRRLHRVGLAGQGRRSRC